MPRGQPDYGMYAVKEVAASISDMGEVAARLGSIVTFDKRGDVVDFDNFESPVLRWTPEGLGVGRYVRFASDNVRSGAQAVQLHSSPGALGQAHIVRDFQGHSQTPLGAEISFSSLSLNGIFSVVIECATGTHWKEFRASYNRPTERLYIDDEAGNPVEVAHIGDIGVAAFQFTTMKLVVEPSTGFYKRLLFNVFEYDISSQAGFSFPVISRPTTGVFLRLNNATLVVNDVWIDDFVFTEAEP